MTKGPFFIFCAVLSVMLICFSSAQITINDIGKSYSLGDELKIKFILLQDTGFEGVVNLNLDCDSYQIQFFATSVKLNANEQKELAVQPLKLTRDGECTLKAELKKIDETIASMESEKFSISSKINLTVNLNKKHFLPEDTVEISGTAKKANNEMFSGEATISLDRDYIVNVRNGKFSSEIKISPKIRSGKHALSVSVNDKEGNSGKSEQEIEVQAVPTQISIDEARDKFLPNEKLSAVIKLYDQAGDEMNESISATLYDIWGTNIQTKVLENDSLFEYIFSQDAMPGNWWIYAYSAGIKERRFFYIEELEKIETEISNGTLTVYNKGNVQYNNPLEITFSSENSSDTEVLDLDIPVNKHSSFQLSAPDGEYNISIKSKNIEDSFDTSLTGKAISIKSVGVKNIFKEIAVITFLLMVIALAIISRRKISTTKVKVKLGSRK